jgi:hypothetical protein
MTKAMLDTGYGLLDKDIDVGFFNPFYRVSRIQHPESYRLEHVISDKNRRDADAERA